MNFSEEWLAEHQRKMAKEPSPVMIAFDLSLTTGWAAGRKGDPIPQWGVFELPAGRSYGEIFNAFYNAVSDLFDAHHPTQVWVERPIPQSRNTAHTAEITLGLHAMLGFLCVQARLPLERPTVQMIRSKVMGRSSLTAAEKAAKMKVKPTIVEPWIRSMGWGVIGHPDARDAAAVWAWAAGVRAARPPRKKAA